MTESDPGAPRGDPEAAPLFECTLTELERIGRGKVRDLYRAGDEHLLIVATDRISAFDVVLPDPIPGKGEVLTSVSNFWFARTGAEVPNHLAPLAVEDFVADPRARAELRGRAVVVRRCRPLPIEAVVRGYLIGSGWQDYQRTGAVCGITLPPGLPLAGRLPAPIFTPATKAAAGEHDENIAFERVRALLGAELAERVRVSSVRLYTEAAAYAASRGIIIADTKLEFGLDAGGELVLIDELLTPDSSRFWPADGWRTGTSPPSFDKQYVRDYLQSLDWDKRAPGPHLPAAVIARTAQKYREARRRLCAD